MTIANTSHWSPTSLIEAFPNSILAFATVTFAAACAFVEG
jgi:hypothetical protein